MKEKQIGTKQDLISQEYYEWMIKQQYDKNWEHLPDYMKRPKWVNRELKIDEILKDDVV
jgi:hypothetical protein